MYSFIFFREDDDEHRQFSTQLPTNQVSGLQFPNPPQPVIPVADIGSGSNSVFQGSVPTQTTSPPTHDFGIGAIPKQVSIPTSTSIQALPQAWKNQPDFQTHAHHPGQYLSQNEK